MVQQHFTVTDDQYVTLELLKWATMGGEESCAPLDPPVLFGEVSRTRRTPEFPFFSFLRVFTALCLKMLTGKRATVSAGR